MSVTIVVGGGQGHEDKGKVVAYLALADQAVLAARACGSPEHSIEWNGRRQTLSLLSCAFIQPDARLLVGPGRRINVATLLDEVERLGAADRLGVDRRCLIQDGHKRAAEVTALQPFLTDACLEFSTASHAGRVTLIEGGFGFAASPIFGADGAEGVPDTTAQQCCVELGIGPTLVTDVLVVVPASLTGQTVSPPEEPGMGGAPPVLNFDAATTRAAVLANAATAIVLGGLNERFARAQGAQRRSHLPAEARQFIDQIEATLGVPVALVSTGPSIEHIVDLR